jgi:hypothetical protein
MDKVIQALKTGLFRLVIWFLGLVGAMLAFGAFLGGDYVGMLGIGVVAAIVWGSVKFSAWQDRNAQAKALQRQAQFSQFLAQIDADYNTATAKDVLYSQPAALLEERVVDRQYVGASAGVRFRVMNGVSVGFGQQRGRMVSQTGITIVSSGTIALTKDRVIFSGNKKSVTIPFTKVLGVSAYANAFDISVDNANTRMFQVQGPVEKNAEFVEVLEHLMAKV